MKEQRHTTTPPQPTPLGMHATLSLLSKEVGRLLAQRRHSAALIKLTEIVSSAQPLRNDPEYAVLQADALGWIGFVYRQMKRYDEAEAYIDEAIDILRQLQQDGVQVSRSLAKTYVNKAANVLEMGYEEEADVYFDDAFALAHHTLDDPCLLVEICYEGAMLFGEIAYIEDARQVVHMCDEDAERIWLLKLDRLEKRLLRKRQMQEHDS